MRENPYIVVYDQGRRRRDAGRKSDEADAASEVECYVEAPATNEAAIPTEQEDEGTNDDNHVARVPQACPG